MMDGDTPRRTATGAPVLRALWVPRESVTIVDTWSVMGMRGTGSQDFTVDDVFVPARAQLPVGRAAARDRRRCTTSAPGT